jgi:hypothetical protein
VRTIRSVDTVRLALAAAMGFTTLSCGSNGSTAGPPEGAGDTGPAADAGVPYTADATSLDATSSDARSSDAQSRSDAMYLSDGTATGAPGPGDGTAGEAADAEGPDGAAGGCTPVLVGGQDTGYVRCNGQLQRHAIVDCPNLIAQGTPPLCGDAALCNTYQDCTANPNGYCVYQTFRGIVSQACGCAYGCVRDSDCSVAAAGVAGGDNICVCADPIGWCSRASCNAGTCAAGFACAEYAAGCGTRFACQSAADQCEVNDQCPGAGLCQANADGGSYCIPSPACATGRPFLVAGEARVAAVASADAWHAAAVAPDSRELSAAQRAELARHWTATARMEHASIAAFARFALQLLAVAAPPDLLLDAQRAMADETAHAQLAFALASAFAGHDLGPGPLAIDAALDETGLQDLVFTTFVEGCIGETAAAVEATEAASLARDPAVRAALDRIAADETRHAELAWRTVAWALRQGGETVGDVVRRAIMQAEVEARGLGGGLSRRDDEHLAAYGVLGEQHKRRLRREVLTEIILPSARALVGSSLGSDGEGSEVGTKEYQRGQNELVVMTANIESKAADRAIDDFMTVPRSRLG